METMMESSRPIEMQPAPEIVSRDVKDDASNGIVHEENTLETLRTEVLQGSVALDAARRSHPPRPWSAQMVRLYGCVTVAFLCSTLNGRELNAKPILVKTFSDRFRF